MYVCMYVCVCVFIHIYIYMYVCIWVCVYVCMCVYMYMYMYIHIYIYIYLFHSPAGSDSSFLRAERKNLSSLFAPVVQGVGGRVTLEPRAYGGETLRTQS